jgi:hypothetical protein
MRPQGVRRLERIDPASVPEVAATVGDPSTDGCLAALHAAVDLYRRLRDDPANPVERRDPAEREAVAYLDGVAAGSRPA